MKNLVQFVISLSIICGMYSSAGLAENVNYHCQSEDGRIQYFGALGINVGVWYVDGDRFATESVLNDHQDKHVPLCIPGAPNNPCKKIQNNNVRSISGSLTRFQSKDAEVDEFEFLARGNLQRSKWVKPVVRGMGYFTNEILVNEILICNVISN